MHSMFNPCSGDNCGLTDISTASKPNENGVESWLLQTASSSLWTQSLFLGASGTPGDAQVRVPRYFNSNGIDSSALNITSDDASESLHFGDYDFMAPNSFEGPTTATNDAFLPGSARSFGSINPTVGPATSDSAVQACHITQHIDPSALKKRKTSSIPNLMEPVKDAKVFDRFDVLNLLFKYAQDFTMTQMFNIAEDTGYAPEFVVNSYLRYRKAVKSNSGLLGHNLSTERWPPGGQLKIME
jgi:hypothetical protein